MVLGAQAIIEQRAALGSHSAVPLVRADPLINAIRPAQRAAALRGASSSVAMHFATTEMRPRSVLRMEVRSNPLV